MSDAPKYIAEVRNSQEVTLYGSADLAFWKEKLLSQNLVPVENSGQAQLMISAVASSWLGVRFKEFLIAVLVNPVPHTLGVGSSPGLYLLTAYNTSRPFVFIEQRYFQTPYNYGKVEVRSEPQPAFELRQRTSVFVNAVCTTPVSAAPTVNEVWEGTIYLPPRPAQARTLSKVFYARLGGLTEISSFHPGADTFRITPSPSEPVLSWVLESGFAGREWHVRRSATHARSQTYPRS